MSTNATATVYSEWGDHRPLFTVYKHWDGYPDGFGEDLRAIAAKYTVGNGISADSPEHFANGAGCFAAFLVQELKDGPGDVYISPLDDRQEYNYQLRLVGEHMVVTCDEEPDW